MRKILNIMLVFVILLNIPIKVFADDIDESEDYQINEEILSISSNIEEYPNISSRACVVIDRNSKRILFEKNAYSKRPMASTTKILTATLVLENANLQDIVEVSKKAASTGGSRLGLKAKDKISVNDLLYGLMLRSRK